MLVLSWTQLWKVNYLDSNEVITNMLLWCWWQGPIILNPVHLNWLWSMYVCYVMIVIWLKGSSHDYNGMLKLKVYSLASVSKVKGLFSLMNAYELLW